MLRNVRWKIRIYTVPCWCIGYVHGSGQCAENTRGIEQDDRHDLSFFNFARISTHIPYRFRGNNKPVLLSHRPRRSSQKYLSLWDKREYHGARAKRIMTPFLHLHSALLFTELSSHDRGKCAIRNQKFLYLFPNKTLFQRWKRRHFCPGNGVSVIRDAMEKKCRLYRRSILIRQFYTLRPIAMFDNLIVKRDSVKTWTLN